MARWEYKVDTTAQAPHELEAVLGGYGADGWRVISVGHPAPRPGGLGGSAGPITVVLEREALG
jgi:hypothetical protein